MKTLRYVADYPGLPAGVDTAIIQHSETCVAHRVPVEMTVENDEIMGRHAARLQSMCVHPGDTVTVSDELALTMLPPVGEHGEPGVGGQWVEVREEAASESQDKPTRRGRATATEDEASATTTPEA